MSIQAFSFDLGLPETPLVENLELYFELLKVYNALRNTASQLDYITGALTPPEGNWAELGVANATHSKPKFYMEAYEDLSYGNTIEIFDAGSGVGQAKKGTSGKVVGFCSAPLGTLTGDTTEVTIFGMYPAFSAGSLTPGTIYGQSATAGVLGAGFTQHLGFALSDTLLYFFPQL
jgi:hypothetical protein